MDIRDASKLLGMFPGIPTFQYSGVTFTKMPGGLIMPVDKRPWLDSVNDHSQDIFNYAALHSQVRYIGPKQLGMVEMSKSGHLTFRDFNSKVQGDLEGFFNGPDEINKDWASKHDEVHGSGKPKHSTKTDFTIEDFLDGD